MAVEPRTGPRAHRASPGGGNAARSREKILAVASRMIARQGIRGLRVVEVANAADVSTALLYYHFGNRSGLVNASFEFAYEKAPSTGLHTSSDDGDGYQCLEDAMLAELDDDPNVRDFAIVWGEVAAAAVFDRDLRPGVRRITHSWRATVAGAIERGIADGSIRDDVDAEAAAEMLIVLVDGCCVRWLAGSLDIDDARRLVLRAVGQLRSPD
jgi:AcrR family transcriptional regulator